jgi:deoxyribonuclease-2
LFLQILYASQLSCKNINNENIPWFAALKYNPTKDKNPNHENGMGYAYYDPREGLTEPQGNMNTTTNNAFYYSTKPIYDDQNTGFVLFNDQPPADNDIDDDLGAATDGHMKGIIMFDKYNAVYIEHSFPRYLPYSKYGYFFPDNAVRNAQSAMCITFKASELETIAQHLAISRPIFYDSRLPSYTSSIAPTLLKVINKEWNDSVTTMKSEFTVDGNLVILFSKSRKYGADIYNDFIAQELKADLYAITWNKGATYLNMPSNCSLKYATYNINNVEFLGVKWRRTQDHSKWAVGNNYVCFSGTNRQTSQTKRGGSAFCIKNSKFAMHYRLAIEDFEECV